MWLCLAPPWEVKLDKPEREPSWQLGTPRPRTRVGSAPVRRRRRVPAPLSWGQPGAFPRQQGSLTCFHPALGSCCPRCGGAFWVMSVCLPAFCDRLPLPPLSVALVLLGVVCAADPAWGRAGGWSRHQRCVPAQLGSPVCPALCFLLARVNVACFGPYV